MAKLLRTRSQILQSQEDMAAQEYDYYKRRKALQEKQREVFALKHERAIRAGHTLNRVGHRAGHGMARAASGLGKALNAWSAKPARRTARRRRYPRYKHIRKRRHIKHRTRRHRRQSSAWDW